MNKVVLDFPTELQTQVGPDVYRRLEQIYRMLFAIQQAQQQTTQQVPVIVKRQLQLLGVLREPLVGAEVADPYLSTAATVPGTVTDLTGSSGSGNITVTVTGSGPGNGNKNVQVSLTNTPTFTTVNATAHYEVAGVQVVGAQGAAIPDAAGGAVIDVEGRAATNAILAFLRTWGAIAP